MHTPNLINIESEYLTYWQHFKDAYNSKRLAHAQLLRASSITKLTTLYHQIITTLLCKQDNQPCGSCKSCILNNQGMHPDLYQIKPEKVGGVIKVEQIRDLHLTLYTSPQVSENKVILILNAERMNHAAANSLLKILEEPPANIYFILTIESISTLPATIFSRCQHWYFPDPTHEGDYFLQNDKSFLENHQNELFKQKEVFIDDLIAIRKERVSINIIAEKWAIYELVELTRLLYLITAQMIHNYFYKDGSKTALAAKLNELNQDVKVTHLFSLIDKLNQLSKNLSYSINVNQLLTLEDLLLSFL
ncbi:DNA polymerase III, delta' subunit [Legionella busanensis]|uniref:DNA-directed DNA polymerase n=2 Tax=Legionella busanensis TaxID=190655 RepID=A0A378JKT5_9GAMM|nr:DNA polymerase III, delta' subunit [Legionella busanensis]